MSQRTLSVKSGVSRSYICELEQGKYDRPSIFVICSLAMALECTLDDLVNFEDFKKRMKLSKDDPQVFQPQSYRLTIAQTI